MDLSVWWSVGAAARVAALALALSGAVPGSALAKGQRLTDATAAASTVATSALPAEARATQSAISAGGPFRTAKDGVVFGNRERLLAPQPRGYYREYTVPTPGVRHRGARRIVCGGARPTLPDACYYSDDHYASFRRIVP